MTDLGPSPEGAAWPAPSETGDEPAPAKRRAAGVIGVVLAVVFVLTAGSVAVALYALRGSPESLGRMVPASADVYVSVNLDPGVGQKAALATLASKVPSLRDASAIRKSVESAVDDALRSVSPKLSFHRDVEPWLGTQVAAVAEVSHGRGAFLIAATDDDAAQASLAKATAASGEHWTTVEHDGVTIHVGSGGGAHAEAYAVLDSAAVLGSLDMVESIVDADHGATPRLTDSASYTTTVSSLPGDRLGLVYVNYPALVKDVRDSGVDADVFGAVAGGISPDAYQGLGLALSAASDGLALDVSVPLDPSKLTAEDRALLSTQRDPGPLLGWVPAPASFFLAAPGAPLDTLFRSLERSPMSSGLPQELQKLGITGPDGLEQHLTGDIVVEGGTGSSGPNGVVLLGTDDEAAMQSALDRVAHRLVPQLATNGSKSVTVTSTGTLVVRHPHTRVRWETVTDDGVTIRFATDSGGALSGLQPAYAVSDGMGIIGTSPEAVQAVLDTKHGAPSIANDPAFVMAANHAGPPQGDVVFVNIHSLLRVVPGQTSEVAQGLRSLIATDHFSSDRITERVFLSIG
jgi:hypothetical protein